MRFLLLNQTFYPDVMATGQYLAETAVRLVERGHEVTVVSSRRAYDHPEKQFPKFEIWRGVRIYRVGSTSFGKGAKWRRAADFASFIVLCCLRVLFLPRADTVVALTTPPLISFIGAWLARLWRASFVYWVMDFNPDEAIAAGWLRAGSMAAKALDAMSRFSLRRARKIIALDRFMRDRIVAKGIAPDKIAVIPPWSHDDEVRFDPEGRARFRKEHGLEDKFVVMYSGNHSPVHPLETLLQAAERLATEGAVVSPVVFCFVGGGSEWRRIKQRTEGRGQRTQDRSSPLPAPRSLPAPVLCLPYQPLNQLAGSLSAADLHVVVMGDAMLGLVHPCKIYNILSVGAPVLYIGPRPSHITDIMDELAGVVEQRGSGQETAEDRRQRTEDRSSLLPAPCSPHVPPYARVAHGDVAGVVQAIRLMQRRAEIREGSAGSGERGAGSTLGRFGKETLLPQLVAELERAGESR